jgi:hypothetical protein
LQREDSAADVAASKSVRWVPRGRQAWFSHGAVAEVDEEQGCLHRPSAP